jgi:large subunit ribosomal protein L4
MAVSVDILNSQGEAAGALEVSDALLGQPDRPQIVRIALDSYLANRRHGSANSRTRGEVRGGGAKPWRQKGTGRARAGSRRSPLWRGGAVTFGPKPRDFGYRTNRKVRRQALLSALSSLQREQRLVVLDKIELPAPRTREVVQLRERLSIDPGYKVLILTDSIDPDLRRAAANLGLRSLHPTRVLPLNNMNIFELLFCDYLILTADGLKALEETYG